MNHHHKVNSAAPERPKAAAAAAASGVTSSIVDPVGVLAPTIETESATIESTYTPREVTNEEVAKLAYSYWIARGYQHGEAEQDWLRAEQELKSRR